jgi:hypothetical protein
VGMAAEMLPGAGRKKRAEAVKELKREAESMAKTGQYTPMPRRKKNVAIVVSERKLAGRSADEDFEEAGLPSVSLDPNGFWAVLLSFVYTVAFVPSPTPIGPDQYHRQHPHPLAAAQDAPAVKVERVSRESSSNPSYR